MMNDRLLTLKRRLRAGEHHCYRKTSAEAEAYARYFLAECEREGLSWMQRAARLTRRQCEAETPVILPDERIVFTRTVTGTPPLYSPQDWAAISAGRTLHELGPISNICADWEMALSQGLLGRREAALASLRQIRSGSQEAEAEKIEFLECALETIEAVLELAARYAAEAERQGREDLAEVLRRVPAQPPRTFQEALQALRLCHAVVWLSGHYHVGLGRLDQTLWPYLKGDLDAGRLSLEEAGELLAEFFLALNKDSDLYPGVQQGDNGQTVTLGGVRGDGTTAANELTRMALRVSRDLGLIDPKINLRISAGTDLDLLCLASELTRQGLGFPQYANDEVVIPGLVAHGYDLEDAREYTVAACWEFIIPGKGMEVVNIGAVSFPAAADEGIRAGMANGASFEEVLDLTAASIRRQVQNLAGAYDRLLLPPAPYYSVLMDGCLERAADLSSGAKYNNFGVHGACPANAADALAAVRKWVYEEKSLPTDELLSALDTDYAGNEPLRRRLAEESPRTGSDDEAADGLLRWLYDTLAEACEGYGKTTRGGSLRPGTGSAMYYLWLARGRAGMREPAVGATADGRRRGDPFSANLSASPGARTDGPFSLLRSFSKIDYRRMCNGGPITLELSDTVFRSPEAVRKVALLVRAFAQLGCQQLQLNSLNAGRLLEARAHPELHKDLIVRVWGWSGYFCELAPEYQEHVIARQLYQIP
jgi:formate C-acetyltransferase